MISDNSSAFFEQFDCVCMLTWSNWHTEMRSNRYHFGTRFARHLPVLFVQPDLATAKYEIEATDVDNLKILHVYQEYGRQQTTLLNQALHRSGFGNPLLWIYNVYFTDFVKNRYAYGKVYHATEDYFCPDFMVNSNTDDLQRQLRQNLNNVDLTIAVTEGVKDSFIHRGGHQGEIIVSQNGCDFDFWRPTDEELKHLENRPSRRIALYQGGISHKLDFDLLQELADALPDWEFQFCGEVVACFSEWRALQKRPNVNYLGLLDIDDLRQAVHQADVGIIPFVQNDWIVKRSFPLKAFEYVAAGLPVVSTPVDTLRSYTNVFQFAKTATEFANAIPRVAQTRSSPDSLAERCTAARQHDYETRFARVIQKSSSAIQSRTAVRKPLKILVLHEDQAAADDATFAELCKFKRAEEHSTFYLPMNQHAQSDLSSFDVVVLHDSLANSNSRHLVHLVEMLEGYGGIRVLLNHSESATTRTGEEWLAPLGIHLFISDGPAPTDFASRHPQIEYQEAINDDASDRDYADPLWRFLAARPTVGNGVRPVSVLIGTQHSDGRTVDIASDLIDESLDVKPLPSSMPMAVGQVALNRLILRHQPIRLLAWIILCRTLHWLTKGNRVVKGLPAMKSFIGRQLHKFPPAFFVARAFVRGFRHGIAVARRLGRLLIGRSAVRRSA